MAIGLEHLSHVQAVLGMGGKEGRQVRKGGSQCRCQVSIVAPPSVGCRTIESAATVVGRHQQQASRQAGRQVVSELVATI